MDVGWNKNILVGFVGKVVPIARRYFARRSSFHNKRPRVVFARTPVMGRYQLCPIRVPATPARRRVRR